MWSFAVSNFSVSWIFFVVNGMFRYGYNHGLGKTVGHESNLVVVFRFCGAEYNGFKKIGGVRELMASAWQGIKDRV
ncbi:Hypothetical protein DEACI_2023 [Acididesulfobacillus acetoxydans]|uniref:Uncharacterized protein n=1 Tax=Acididesulfobacillus acetoxydans TaxID=1561005 RepID=A0A8S0XWY7_9FIRM|nr:Hypothetical protein DEACI_2023 [Acididesulfobacillus acetoxydans]CEJ06022.1 Hypothetical protein DEACI_0468 [Acididesulfobacillus acetoxydans]